MVSGADPQAARDVAARDVAAGQGPAGARSLPPVTQCAVAALIFVVAGGIELAARLPRPAPLWPAVAALILAAVALAAAVIAVSRLRNFAWHVFWVAGGWTLAAYTVIAGMLEFVFALDRTPGPLLTVLSLMLVVFAVDIPLLLAFSAARYQPASRGRKA